MSENYEDPNLDQPEDENSGETITRVTGMFKDWFLDYASYVILERAVPAIEDGFKPVQRRIMHSMKDLDDGRYNKVANIVGHTMQYHPHGDASIADAMVQMGQKDLLIDTQGNVVGIVNAKLQGYEGLGFAIPSKVVVSDIDLILAQIAAQSESA